MFRVRIEFLGLIIFSLFLITNSESKAQRPSDYEFIENISYIDSPADAYQDSICKLDIYYPKNQKHFPSVIWYHGGGMTGGRKVIPAELKNKGIAVIAVGYRLSPLAKNPDYLKDAAQAAAWVFNNIEKYSGDRNKIVLSGHSAGAYLAMMIGMDAKWLEEYDIKNTEIAALMPLSGQCITHFTIRKENKIPELRPVIDEFAPLYYVTNDIPEITLITGDRNMELLGRYEENAYLKRMLELNGKKDVQLYELEGFDHGEMTRPGCILLANILRKKFHLE